VILTSNGVNDWKTDAEFAAESPVAQQIVAGADGAAGGTGATGATGADGSGDSAEFQLTLSAQTLSDYDLAAACPGIKAGDILAIVLTGNVIVHSIIPPSSGFWCWVGIRDNNGSSITFVDQNNGAGGTAANQFRTPGATSPSDVGPNYVLSSEEDWTAIGYTSISTVWRILTKNSAGTNSQLSVGGGGIPAPFDATGSVACYNFLVPDGTDSSSNAFTLTGTGSDFTESVPQRYALRAGTMSRASFDATLAITGDKTIEIVGRYIGGGTAVNIVQFTSTGETLATNTLYLFGITSTRKLRWFSERGAGLDDELVAASAPSVPTNSVVMISASLISDVATLYMNGKLVATSGTLNTPEGGTSSRLMITSAGDFEVMQVRLTASGKTAAQHKAAYNDVMGVAYGMLA
jgi:hypothetical protein